MTMPATGSGRGPDDRGDTRQESADQRQEVDERDQSEEQGKGTPEDREVMNTMRPAAMEVRMSPSM